MADFARGSQGAKRARCQVQHLGRLRFSQQIGHGAACHHPSPRSGDAASMAA
jgi:hypothetical protein